MSGRGTVLGWVRHAEREDRFQTVPEPGQGVLNGVLLKGQFYEKHVGLVIFNHNDLRGLHEGPSTTGKVK